MFEHVSKTLTIFEVFGNVVEHGLEYFFLVETEPSVIRKQVNKIVEIYAIRCPITVMTSFVST